MNREGVFNGLQSALSALGTSTKDLQWIIAVYMLAAPALIVVTGIVADRFG
ncbi:hypothetical protein [Streptomyces sp. 2323.1]|uniref:hypothetical protein n=1 Tax=Streptomyces sp. 2323.1 TaxID=1938841 RepID=UPI00133194E2|nr:hypothetical protein [Streptomyces sp. 2323.1]